MGKKYGNEYRLWVESAVAGTFNEIKGQTELEIDESGDTIDTTSKDNFPYKTSGPGMRSLTLSVGVVPDLPDATGYSRLETLAKSASPAAIKLQIRKAGSGGVSPGDVVHECEWHTTGRPRSFPMNGVVGAKFNFSAAAAPTTDTLA